MVGAPVAEDTSAPHRCSEVNVRSRNAIASKTKHYDAMLPTCNDVWSNEYLGRRFGRDECVELRQWYDRSEVHHNESVAA